jgi:hypothetical protein
MKFLILTVAMLFFLFELFPGIFDSNMNNLIKGIDLAEPNEESKIIHNKLHFIADMHSG